MAVLGFRPQKEEARQLIAPFLNQDSANQLGSSTSRLLHQLITPKPFWSSLQVASQVVDLSGLLKGREKGLLY